MATSAQTLIDRTRRFLRDWPSFDSLTASMTSSTTTMTVADSSVYKTNWLVEIGSELLRVKAQPTSLTVTVARSQLGSTAATHASGDSILVQPQFYVTEILDALNNGIDAAFPYLYKEVLDTSLSIDASTYEYTIPYMSSPSTARLWRISRVELQESGDNAFRQVNNWDVRRGSTPKLKFRTLQTQGATVRLHGFGPFPHLASTSDTLDAQWPYQCEEFLVQYAAAYLLQSGEARRVRVDTGPVDQRENANKTGSSLYVSSATLARAERLLQRHAMPAMPPHVVSTF